MRMRWKSRKTLTATTAITMIAAGAALAAPGAAHAATGAAPGSQVTGTLPNGTTWVADFPASWNGTLLLYSHGFGPLTAADAPDPNTQAALLADGYALAGSSYDPNGSEWALNTAVSDQFGTLAAVESTVLPSRPKQVIAVGTSMGGLVSALEAQQGAGKINGALTTCGIVDGGVSLNEYQIDGEYAIAQLLGDPKTQLVGFGDEGTALGTAAALTADANAAQPTAAGKARLALAMAFLNVTPWDPSAAAAAPDSDPAAQESAQYDTLFGGSFSIMDFIELGRISIEQADGGQATWDVGTDFAKVLANSPFKQEVQSLYKAAGLNLNADLATLTTHTSTQADPAALQSLESTSVPTGRLAVPELDLHTIGDNLVPVQNEYNYGQLVNRAGSGSLLRQAYTDSYGHCNFSPSELVAGVQAVMHRVTTGHWDNAATAASLEQAAAATNLGTAKFTDYHPGELTGAVTGS
ncbi:MAG TPA: hypothetical protein VF223_05990 [Trebonia sp.]